MKIKTTIKFKPSEDVLASLKTGNPGEAGYKARVFVDGQERPETVLPAGADSLVIEAEEGQKCGVLLAARAKDGTFSLASTFEFTAINKLRPQRPTALEISEVVEVVEAKAIARPQIPQAPTDDAEGYFNITVVGHSEIKDGAVGTVTGLDPITKDRVHATFGHSSLKSGVELKGQGNEYEFGLDFPGAKIITAEQDTISLRDYAEIVLSRANAVADALAGASST